MPKQQEKKPKGGHWWQRKANVARKAKRVRHFSRAHDKALRRIARCNGNSEAVKQVHLDARARSMSVSRPE